MSARKDTGVKEHKGAKIIALFAAIALTLFCRASANNNTQDSHKDSELKIYLPREVTVQDNCLTMGQISIIRGTESLTEKASKIALGRISVPEQKIIIDRPTVLSRLVCNGIPASQITLIGAEKITVKQQQQIISSSKFITLANSFIQKNLADDSVCQWDPIRKPQNLVITGPDKDIKFSLRLVQNRAAHQAKVEISVLSGEKKIGVREVIFRLKYHCRRAVTKVDIPTGGIISKENITIEKVLSNYPEPADWKPPYGLIAKRRLPAKTVLRSYMTDPLKSPIVVKRNQNVVIRIEKLGFLITAMGTAMQEARAGECIKVRNVDSQRIIFARINEDGSAEPLF